MTQSGHSLIGRSSRIKSVLNTYGSNLKSGIVRGPRPEGTLLTSGVITVNRSLVLSGRRAKTCVLPLRSQPAINSLFRLDPSSCTVRVYALVVGARRAGRARRVPLDPQRHR